MALPLYKTDGNPAPDGHAGLWFDKFCWTLRTSDKDNLKLDWIKSVTERPVGTSDQLREYAMRLLRLIQAGTGHAAVFVTEWRFVTGLGRSHPVENGFAWHPTLGTPYLPGSSIKGLVRAWATLDSNRPSDEGTVTRLLGNRRAAGNLRFLDALPVEPVNLRTDVMTPHFAGWTEQEPPGDWRSPTPIPFLTTAADTPFLFGILPSRAVGNDDLKTAAAWLCEALSWAGAGAKTAVGYGRFRNDEEQTTHWKERAHAERERQEALRSPEGRWRLKLKELSEAEILDMIRVYLLKDPIGDPSERIAFAHAVLAVVSTDSVAHWRRGTAREAQTQLGKKKLRERARLLDDALEPSDE